MSSIRVVLIDDHSLVREGIRMILENDGSVHVTGTAGSVTEAA
jgi:DNA-binding NarL/FixJ family response regulator